MTNTQPQVGNVITDPRARKAVYATFVLVGIAAGAITVAFATVGPLPTWVTVMNAVLAFLGASGLGTLAVANTATSPAADTPRERPGIGEGLH